MSVQLTIIGLGQIGSSIGLALKAHNVNLRLVGHDKDPQAAKEAQRIGAVDDVKYNLPASVREAKIVILALPLAEVRETLRIIAPDLQEGALILDTAPAKATGAAAVTPKRSSNFFLNSESSRTVICSKASSSWSGDSVAIGVRSPVNGAPRGAVGLVVKDQAATASPRLSMSAWTRPTTSRRGASNRPAVIDIGGSILVNSAYLSPPYEIKAVGPPDLYQRLQQSVAFVQFVQGRIESAGVRLSVAELAQQP